MDPIDTYIKSLSARPKDSDATEHTHRPALQNLLEALLPDLTIINEPKRQACGMPDFKLLRNRKLIGSGVPVAYIETKNLDDGDLDGVGKNKGQFDRYKAALDNVVFTDYLDFVFYKKGIRLGSVAVGELKGKEIKPAKANYDTFRRMMKDLGASMPQKIVSGRALAEIMAGKARLMATVIEDLLQAGDGDLTEQLAVFQDVLIKEMTKQEFADVYAQTITYGLFAARIHDKEATGFSRERAAKLIPPTNPFLRKLFQAIAGYDLDKKLAILVDDLAEAYGAADVREILAGVEKDGKDPAIYFYENFLSVYDPGERKRKGVYYTPRPIVNFMVRAVDELLQKDFGIRRGLADRSITPVWNGKGGPPSEGADFDSLENWDFPHRVQILDPAVGTGAFLAEVVSQVYQKLKGEKGVWSDYVRNDLLPRLNGFELLMAPYTMAHTMLAWQLTHFAGAERVPSLQAAIDTQNEILAAKRGWKFAPDEEYGEVFDDDPECPSGSKQPTKKISKKVHAALVKAGAPMPASQGGAHGPPQIKRLDRERAHAMALRFKRQNASFAPSEDQRLQIYLTNSLANIKVSGHNTGFFKWLSDEAAGAAALKKRVPIMVVVGNPPYNAESKNKGDWIMHLMEDYKQEPGTDQRLDERNSKAINDDYVKFIRLGQYLIDRYREGIVAYITNHGFLDNPTFRGMRYSLLNSFDKIYIIDLHGNAKKKETAPDGGRDENVFEIQQGVSINIFVRLPDKKKNGQLAEVHHYDLYGTREQKFDYLLSHALLETRANQKLPAVYFKDLRPAAPEYFFVPKDYRDKGTYDKGFSVTDLFPVNSVGILTARDGFTIHESPGAVQAVIKDFLSLTDEEAREKYGLGKDVRDWTVAGAREDLLTAGGSIVEIAYRPFDIRYTRYSGVGKGFHCTPRHEVMKHFLHGENLGLSLCKQFKTGDEYCHALVSENVIESGYVSNKTSEITYLFPLYLYPDKGNRMDGRTPNLSHETVEEISEATGLEFEGEKSSGRGRFAPIDVLDYVYAVLHDPCYREKYAEFLKTNFPKVPCPQDAEGFRAMTKLGARLRKLHLLAPDTVGTPKVRFPKDGGKGHIVDRPRWEPHGDSAGMGRVWINSAEYFDKVPLSAWEMHIGGYQPAQKWLKDRQGKRLSMDQVEHYQRVITALEKTGEVMQELAANARSY